MADNKLEQVKMAVIGEASYWETDPPSRDSWKKAAPVEHLTNRTRRE